MDEKKPFLCAHTLLSLPQSQGAYLQNLSEGMDQQ